VENNFLSSKQIPDWLQKYEEASTDEARTQLVEAASQVDAVQQQKALETKISKVYLTQQQDDLIRLVQSPNCDAHCRSLAQYSIEQLSPIIDNYDVLQRSNNIPRAAIATITLALPVLSKSATPYVAKWVGGATAASRVIGMGTSGGANALMQGYKIYQDPEEDFSYASFGTSILTGGVTPGMKYGGTVSVNTAGAGLSSWVDGKDPLAPMAGAAAGSSFGYYGGGVVLKNADKQLNPWSNGFKERFSLKHPTIAAPATVNPWPGIWGSVTGSVGNEIAGDLAQEEIKDRIK
ncbi:hypothetical protein SJI19_24090, partial [Acerihabitans sp. TG2]|uniref:hypothetical protein n=1 Tax=Acerihabitans sp. TG2 TaxID=3096008 RepID=UPI002B2237B3